MNKNVLAIIVFMLLTLLLVSCNNAGQPGNTTEESESTADPADTSPEVVEKVYTEDELRAMVSDYMRKMGSVEWTAKEDMDYSKAISITGDIIYKAGTKYKGMPYANARVGFEPFINSLDENNVYIGPTGWQECYGNTCTTSIKNAWYIVSNSINFKYAIDMLPSYEGSGILPLGDIPWDKYDGKNTTNSIVRECDANTIYQAYTLLKLGDAVTRYLDSNGHARMVTGKVEVVYNENGTVNPNKSYVVLTEQTSHWIKTTRGELPTHWNVDKEFTFATLYKYGYLPVTIAELQTGTHEKPEFKIENKPISKTFTTTKLFRGNITSSHKLLEVIMTVTSSNGDIIAEYTAYPKEMKYDISEFNDYCKISELPSGVYNHTVKALIGLGEYELLNLDFTLE